MLGKLIDPHFLLLSERWVSADELMMGVRLRKM